MSERHRIRLRGPWEVTGIEPARPSTRMTLPCSWREGGWSGFAGLARHVRLFGRPRQNETSERVWLVVAGVTGQGRVRLNGEELGTIEGRFEHDVSDLLQERNRLEIDVRAEGDDGGVTGEVALEIGRL